MRVQLEQVRLARRIWIWAFSALLIIGPLSVQAEEMISRSEIKERLPELQKAVGKDWSVTALPDGYLLTYAPLVSFYSIISQSSKVDDYQRVEHGQMDHLRIRIALYPPLSVKAGANAQQYNDYWERVEKSARGYFGCGNNDWDMWQDDVVVGRPVHHDIVWFSCNIPPDRLITDSTKNVYEHTLDVLAPYFHAARHAPWIED